MTTNVFPGFGNSTTDPSVPAAADPASTVIPGVAFSVHRKPLWKTNIATSSSGYEARYAQMQWPIWEYELTYEFLDDSEGSSGALEILMGFFLQMQGQFNTWLFKDPDDYQSNLSQMIEYSNSTSTYYATRTFGGFVEPIGQIDTANTYNVYAEVSETDSATSTGTTVITVSNASRFYQDVGVTLNGTSLVKVTTSPGVGQYSVASGVYTIGVGGTQEGQPIVITYIYQMTLTTDYTISMPNRVTFTSAPTGNVYFSGQFFFVCRFMDDQQDYEKFLNKLWDLNECNFRSVLQ